MAVKKDTIEIENRETESIFTKEQIVLAKRYAHQRDLLGVILKEESAYTLKEVDLLIEEFLKSEVK